MLRFLSSILTARFSYIFPCEFDIYRCWDGLRNMFQWSFLMSSSSQISRPKRASSRGLCAECSSICRCTCCDLAAMLAWYICKSECPICILNNANRSLKACSLCFGIEMWNSRHLDIELASSWNALQTRLTFPTHNSELTEKRILCPSRMNLAQTESLTFQIQFSKGGKKKEKYKGFNSGIRFAVTRTATQNQRGRQERDRR